MQPETVRQCMTDLGMSQENAELIAFLLENNRTDEAKQRLRRIRCNFMDEMHACQKKVDQLDWLIRETEKTYEGKEKDCDDERKTDTDK